MILRIINFISKYLSLIAITAVMAMSFSCSNKMEKIRELTTPDTLPAESIKNVEIRYYDSGQLKLVLRAPVLYTYYGSENKMIFPQGLEVLFLNTQGQTTGILRAGYGLNQMDDKVLKVRNNVVLVNNEKQETLETEELNWAQRKQKIFTEAHVKIKTPDKLILGQGLEADEKLKKRTLRNVTGEFQVNEDIE
ncbi:MAG: LPS export ABC transporter periplasmic protein LptC [Bacteroidales bacterium]